MTVISVIVGSTREGRFSEKPAKWILQHLKMRERVDARLLDLRDFPMPFFDQVATPATPGRPAFAHEVVQKWTAAIAQSDGFVFITPEYNFGPSAVLKNAIDWVYPEWNRKAIGFVSMAWGQYGNRVGVPSILKLLAKHSVPATFYVPAVCALLYPDEQRRIIAEGHEIGIHSWIHELNSVLPYEAEKDLMTRATDVLEKTTKVRPVGAHGVLGFLAAYAADHQGGRPALRFLADGRRQLLRQLLRAALGWRANRRHRISGGMDPRRRGLFHDAPVPRPASLYAAVGCVRCVPA